MTAEGDDPLTKMAISVEQRFGHGFGRVRVHNDASAFASANAISARAYTVGGHIIFGQGYYALQPLIWSPQICS
jgi:hypothetical protein